MSGYPLVRSLLLKACLRRLVRGLEIITQFALQICSFVMFCMMPPPQGVQKHTARSVYNTIAKLNAGAHTESNVWTWYHLNKNINTIQQLKTGAPIESTLLPWYCLRACETQYNNTGNHTDRFCLPWHRLKACKTQYASRVRTLPRSWLRLGGCKTQCKSWTQALPQNQLCDPDIASSL